AFPKCRWYGRENRSQSGDFKAGEKIKRKLGVRERTPPKKMAEVWVNVGLSEPILYLVSPITLEPLKRDVDTGELAARDAADLLDCAGVLRIDAGHDAMNLLPAIGEAYPHGAPVDARTGVVEIALLDQFL